MSLTPITEPRHHGTLVRQRSWSKQDWLERLEEHLKLLKRQHEWGVRFGFKSERKQRELEEDIGRLEREVEELRHEVESWRLTGGRKR